jgi:CRISPR-associated RAMP protein (TIGR02581 family)
VNRFELHGVIMLETALHIGTGQASATTDAGVVRDFQGRAFIPGSSLKGAFRSAVERRVEWLGLWSCLLDDQACLTNKRTDDVMNGKPWHEQSLEWRLRKMETELCDTCQLFGSTVLGGKVQVDDASLSEEVELVAQSLIEVRDGVGIDRDAGTAVDQAKFDYEVVPSLTAFRFYLTAENLSKPDWALLALGLLEMMNGNVPLGGKSTRGLGRCRLHLEEAFYFEFPQGAPLESGIILEYLKPPKERRQGHVDKPREFLENRVRSFLEERNHAQENRESMSD